MRPTRTYPVTPLQIIVFGLACAAAAVSQAAAVAVTLF